MSRTLTRYPELQPGLKINRFTFISHEPRDNGHSMSRWMCECGVETLTQTGAVIKGQNKSCGCYRREQLESGLNNRTHGGYYTPEYRVWAKIKERCLNSNANGYDRYGGRGIKICERWSTSFENFRADVGPRPSKDHSIDRIDNSGNYEPGNCRWTTRDVQSRNRRTNVNVEFNGQTMCSEDFAKIVGQDGYLVRYHLKKGRTPQQIVDFFAGKAGAC